MHVQFQCDRETKDERLLEGLMVNDVFTYWWLIMPYQDLIACTVGSLSTAWRPATGHWLHTSLQSLLFQYVLILLLRLLLCGSFPCHVLPFTLLLLFDSWGHFSSNYEGTWGYEGFFMDLISCCENGFDILVQSTFLFIHPDNFSLNIWHF